MNLVVPYVDWPAQLAEHLRGQGHAARYMDTAGDDGYWQVLANQWVRGDTFVVLEADKFPAAGVLEELWACEQPWCFNRVPMRHTAEASPYPSLSCTKFGAELMKHDPFLLEHVGELDLGLGVREWSRLDLGISGLLEAWCTPHEHLGLVEHRH